MPESLHDWREFFRRTDADIFKLIDNAIAVATLDRLDDFQSQRVRIMERLYSGGTGRHVAGDQVGSCDAPSKESKEGSNGRVGIEQDVVDMDKESCCSFGEAEAFAGEVDEQSRGVGEVLRIKQVLDNSRCESASALCESLRKLWSMAITLDIMERTKVGISVDSLRRNCGSKQIAQLADSITVQWKAMVDDDGNPCNIREKNSAIQKPKQHLGVVKPDRSSQTDSRTAPSDKIVAGKFDKERKVQLEKPNKVAVHSRQLPSQKDKLKYLQLQWKSNSKPPRGGPKIDIREKQMPRSSRQYKFRTHPISQSRRRATRLNARAPKNLISSRRTESTKSCGCEEQSSEGFSVLFSIGRNFGKICRDSIPVPDGLDSTF